MKIFTPGDDIHWICRESNFFFNRIEIFLTLSMAFESFLCEKCLILKNQWIVLHFCRYFEFFTPISIFFDQIELHLLFKSDYFSFFHLQSNFINKKFKKFPLINFVKIFHIYMQASRHKKVTKG